MGHLPQGKTESWSGHRNTTFSTWLQGNTSHQRMLKMVKHSFLVYQKENQSCRVLCSLMYHRVQGHLHNLSPVLAWTISYNQYYWLPFIQWEIHTGDSEHFIFNIINHWDSDRQVRLSCNYMAHHMLDNGGNKELSSDNECVYKGFCL